MLAEKELQHFTFVFLKQHIFFDQEFRYIRKTVPIYFKLQVT